MEGAPRKVSGKLSTHGQVPDVQQACIQMCPGVSEDGSRGQVWSAWHRLPAGQCMSGLSEDGSRERFWSTGRQWPAG